MKKVSLLLAALAFTGAAFAQNVTKTETKMDDAATKTKTTTHQMGTKADHKMHKAHTKVKKAM